MKINDYKNIPFYGNTPDNTHCNQAGIKMILGYYFPHEKFSWQELEDITGKKPNKWTWPMKGWLYLASRGLEVKYYGTFDYEKFVQNAEDYLLTKYGKEVGEAQIKNSDIPHEVSVTKLLLEKIAQVKRVPNLDDIEKFISQNCLLLCNVNYYSLYNKSGYAGHFVLIYGIDNDYIYLQDPGLPPNPNAKIPIEYFVEAWEYSGSENKGLTVIRKSK